MTVLLTGFGPFGQLASNPSQVLVESLSSEGLPVEPLVLPTAYARARSLITSQLKQHNFDAVLMLGLAASTPTLRLERIAVNLDSSEKPDIDGVVRTQQVIVEGAPATYQSSLPLGEMLLLAQRHECEVVFSDDAGGYVCNHVFFSAMHHAHTLHDINTERTLVPCGFVHVPPIAAEDHAFDQIRAVLRAWIVALARA